MGGFIIFLVFIGVIYFKFIKPNMNQEPKTQQAPQNQPVQVQPQQERCTNTHDIRYWREYAEQQNQPQYKVDWLEESLKRNPNNRDWTDFVYYAFESFKENLPYICETEDEWDELHHRTHSPLKGSVEGMMWMVRFYNKNSNTGAYDPNKMNFWKEKISSLAQKGDKNAQALLCSSWAARLLPDDIDTYRMWYKDKLLEEAKNGDGYAQLAVGDFLFDSDEEKVFWLKKATEHRLTDAYYALARAYSPDEMENYQQFRIECYKQGAECNNGFHALHCMNSLGRDYLDGKHIPRDLVKAEYWLRKAAEIDPEYVSQNLEWLEEVKNQENGG